MVSHSKTLHYGDTTRTGRVLCRFEAVMIPLQRERNFFALLKPEAEPCESIRSKIADFYAQPTRSKSLNVRRDCANSILWLWSEHGTKTTGHIMPADGRLPEAFLRKSYATRLLCAAG